MYYFNIVLHKYFLRVSVTDLKRIHVTQPSCVSTSVRVVMTGDCEILQSSLKGWCNFLEMTQQQQGCTIVLYVHAGYAHFFNQPLKPCKLENPARPEKLQICSFVYNIHKVGVICQNSILTQK